MKHLLKISILVLFLFQSIFLSAQNEHKQKVQTDANEVTVFLDGAQVTRKKTVSLQAGKTELTFSDLSPYIDAKSVQVKMSGAVMVTSVNHQHNYIDTGKVMKPVEVIKRMEAITDELSLISTNRDILKEEMSFLEANKKIGGANSGISAVTLKEATAFYRERMTSLKKEDYRLQQQIKALNEEYETLRLRAGQEGGTVKRKTVGEVVVDVETKTPVRATIELTYYVKGANWFPAYDVRAGKIGQPIDLVYKANVRQNTGEDWKNVSLKISSSNPAQGNVLPALKTYYLNYNILAPRYETLLQNDEVAGVVVDELGEPLIGAAITFPGTTIGTVADLNGKFSMKKPNNVSQIRVTYIGYHEQTLPIRDSFMQIVMQPNKQQLDEVVATALQGRVAGVAVTGAAGSTSKIRIRGTKSISSDPQPERYDIAMPTESRETPMAVEFDVKIPYTILSNNKNTLIEVERYALPAQFEYVSIPKIAPEAFLMANASDWQKYNLLDGEANVFFEDTYVGKTVLDLRNIGDTLSLSLGRDKNISVKRELLKDYTTKKLFGSKKEDTRSWKISTRNGKQQPIDIVILDQVPVSQNNEIEVEVEKQSGGRLNAETGEVKWVFTLKPAEKKDLKLRYKVKYNKDKILNVE